MALRLTALAAALQLSAVVAGDPVGSIGDATRDCVQCLATGGDGDCSDECDVINNADNAENQCCAWWSCSSCPTVAATAAATTTATTVVATTPATTKSTASTKAAATPKPTQAVTTPAAQPLTTPTVASSAAPTTHGGETAPCTTDADCRSDLWCFTSTHQCTAYVDNGDCSNSADGKCGLGDGDCDVGECAAGLFCSQSLNNCGDYHAYNPNPEADCCAPVIACKADNDCPASMWCFSSTGTCGDYADNGICSGTVGGCGLGDGDCEPGECSEGLFCSQNLNNCGDYHAYNPNAAAADCCTPPIKCSTDADCPASMWCFSSSGTCGDYADNGICSGTVGGCGLGDGDCEPGECADGLFCSQDLNNCGDYHSYNPNPEADCCAPVPTTTTTPSCTAVYQGEVCMDAAGDALVAGGRFQSSVGGAVEGAYLVYKSGYVDCNKGGNGSHWGCESDAQDQFLGAFIVDGAAAVANGVSMAAAV